MEAYKIVKVRAISDLKKWKLWVVIVEVSLLKHKLATQWPILRGPLPFGLYRFFFFSFLVIWWWGYMRSIFAIIIFRVSVFNTEKVF